MFISFQPEVQIVDQFTEPIWYIVTADSSSGDQEVMTVTCDQSEGTCSASSPLLEAADYTVSISAMNIVGGSDSTIYPNEIRTLSCTPHINTHTPNNILTNTHTHTHTHTQFRRVPPTMIHPSHLRTASHQSCVPHHWTCLTPPGVWSVMGLIHPTPSSLIQWMVLSTPCFSYLSWSPPQPTTSRPVF